MKFFHYFSAISMGLVLAACTPSEKQETSNQTVPTQQQKASEPIVQHDAQWETVLVGSELNFPPFEFKNQQGQATGFEVELLYAIAQAEKFNVQILPIQRDKFTEGLNDKQYRIAVAAIAINAERSNRVDFSQPILDYDREIYLLDTPKNETLKTVADFKGKKLAASRSFNTAQDIVGTSENVFRKDTFYLALKAMYQGEVDGTLGDSRVLAYFAKQYPDIKTRQISLGEQKRELAFAVAKGDKEILDKINRGLNTIKENGTYQALLDKWFATK